MGEMEIALGEQQKKLRDREKERIKM